MKIRCQHLDGDGRQCRSHETEIEQLFANREFYEITTWVVISLCDKHANSK